MAVSSPIMQKLIQIPIFRGLTEPEAAAIFELSEETSLDKGTVIFREGEDGDAVYAVLSGHVQITKRDPQGKDQLLASLGAGAVLGEMSLIGGGCQRSATATADSDGRLLKIQTSRFERLLRSDSVAAYKIVHNLAQVLSKRLQMMNEKLLDVADKAKKKEELQDFHKLLNEWSF